MEDNVRFWLDVAPQIIAIIVLAVFSWRRMNYMSQHLDAHGEHLAILDSHNKVQDAALGLAPKGDPDERQH
jgi:hypothetical protein